MADAGDPLASPDDPVALYRTAADRAEARGDIEAACFYLTHAFVHALQAGAPEAVELNRRLVVHGREVPL